MAPTSSRSARRPARTRRAQAATAEPARLTDAKYDALLSKYQALVRKYEGLGAERLAVVQLAFWTLRNRTSGVALVQQGLVTLTNNRWNEFDAPGQRGGWRLFRQPASERASTFHTLREMAGHHAAHIEAGGPSSYTCVLERVDAGQEQYLEARFDQPGAARSGVFVLVHDVTAAVRAERELAAMREAAREREKLELLGELASSVAHDFNNSFFALGLQLQRLIGLAQDPSIREQLARILEVVRTDSQRVRNLQEFARRRQGAPAAALDLCEVVRGAAELAGEHLRHEAAARGVRIALETSMPERAVVRAEVSELRAALLNLVLNARDAMPEGGTIRVAVRVEKERVLLEVSDEGTGIAGDVLPHLFEPRFTTKGGRGTGLGLSTAAAMMKRLGGSIQAQNRRSGGALIRLAFPAAREALPAPGSRSPAVEVPRRRILIVDDELNVLEAMRLALEPHEVVLCTHGAGALARVGLDEPWDLVLCDLGLPDLDGFRVAERIRELRPELPVVLITGWGDEIAPDDPRRRHVLEVLAKPLSIEQLREAISRATARGEGRRRRGG